MKANMKSLKRTLLAATLIVGQTFAMPSIAVLAADSNVRIAGQVVMNEIATAGGMSGDTRASKIQQNLDNALVAAKDSGDQSVGVTYVNGMPVLTLGGYHVATVDGASAKQAGMTPSLLAQRWASALRTALSDTASVNAYIAHLTGETSASPAVAQAPSPSPAANPYFNSNPGPNTFATQPQNYAQSAMPAYQGRVVYAPAGLVIPATLTTSIATNVAQAGDLIQAKTSQAIILGDSQIPVGTTLIGQVSDSKAGRLLGRTGSLDITFTRLRTPDGQEAPLSAELIGGIDKYDSSDANPNTFKGETWKGKAVQAGVRGAIGAGTGAALGTAIGAIAGGGRGAGHGAWSGTAIGAGLGVAQSLIARKGKDVIIQSGTPIQLKLSAPLQLAGSPSTSISAPIAYNGYSQ